MAPMTFDDNIVYSVEIQLLEDKPEKAKQKLFQLFHALEEFDKNIIQITVFSGSVIRNTGCSFLIRMKNHEKAHELFLIAKTFGPSSLSAHS